MSSKNHRYGKWSEFPYGKRKNIKTDVPEYQKNFLNTYYTKEIR